MTDSETAHQIKMTKKKKQHILQNRKQKYNMTPVSTGSKRRYMIWGDDNHYNTLHTYLSRTHLHMTLCFYFELEMRTVFPTQLLTAQTQLPGLERTRFTPVNPLMYDFIPHFLPGKKNENPLTYILLFEFLESKK